MRRLSRLGSPPRRRGPNFLAAILLLSLAACAAAPLRWQRAETSPEAAEKDLADCRVNVPPAISSVTMQMQEIETCMRLKGYSPFILP